MTIQRVSSIPYPSKIETLEQMRDYIKRLYKALTEDIGLRSRDYQMFIDGYTKSIWNDDFDTDAVLDTKITATYGIVIVREKVDGITGVFRVNNITLVIMSMDSAFSIVKNTAASYNVYYEGGTLKVQNKVGNNKKIRVLIYGE